MDSNVIAYCWLNGPLTALAQGVRVKDPEWHVPILWRSEMRSILVGYLRDGSLTVAQIMQVMEAAERTLAGSEHLVPSVWVFEIAARSRLSAYDCEFVVLAEVLGVPLVTADKAVLRAFPDQALTMDAYLKKRRGVMRRETDDRPDRHRSPFKA
ncbi:MAG: type II toxin-antitoxin system VapC family toxin [Pseudomonadota bacterium]|nr:type II toxin-antitoxin system VapC family toxin [Pseudomonadota bacterium]